LIVSAWALSPFFQFPTQAVGYEWWQIGLEARRLFLMAFFLTALSFGPSLFLYGAWLSTLRPLMPPGAPWVHYPLAPPRYVVTFGKILSPAAPLFPGFRSPEDVKFTLPGSPSFVRRHRCIPRRFGASRFFTISSDPSSGVLLDTPTKTPFDARREFEASQSPLSLPFLRNIPVF